MKRYYFNREERYYCALLMQAIMEKPELAGTFLTGHFYSGMELEGYIETSIIRDYWMMLGKPQKSNIKDVNADRVNYLKSLCNQLDIDFNIVKTRKDYTSSNGFINSPGNWQNLEKKEVEAKKLRAIFNMRQDILIIENGSLHFIEAKVESGNSAGQIENFLLLKGMHDEGKKIWGCIDEHFSGIENVFLYYLKRTGDDFRVSNSNVKEDIKIITWKNIFDNLKDQCIILQRHRIQEHIDHIFK